MEKTYSIAQVVAYCSNRAMYYLVKNATIEDVTPVGLQVTRNVWFAIDHEPTKKFEKVNMVVMVDSKFIMRNLANGVIQMCE